MRSASARSSADGVAELGFDGPEAIGDRPERRSAIELGEGRSNQVARATFGAEGCVGGRRRGAVGIGVPEDRLLGEEPIVLVLVGEPRAVDLVELEPDELALAVPRAASPPSSSSVRSALAKRRPSRVELREVDAREAIQRPPLARRW